MTMLRVEWRTSYKCLLLDTMSLLSLPNKQPSYAIMIITSFEQESLCNSLESMGDSPCSPIRICRRIQQDEQAPCIILIIFFLFIFDWNGQLG